MPAGWEVTSRFTQVNRGNRVIRVAQRYGAIAAAWRLSDWFGSCSGWNVEDRLTYMAR